MNQQEWEYNGDITMILLGLHGNSMGIQRGYNGKTNHIFRFQWIDFRGINIKLDS